MFSKKTNAFTLAEVLVTLMIIGVIATLTIPSLKESADKSANLSLLQKAYSSISNVFAQIQAENGPPLYWKLQDGNRVFIDGSSENISTLFKQKMNVAADTNFLPEDYKIKNLKGTEKDSFKIDDTTVSINDNTSAFQATDGMIWFPSDTYSGCKYTKKENDSNIDVFLCGLLIVDTNSYKKPNRMGIDVFVFDITTEGIKPHFGTDDDCADMEGDGYTCAAKVLNGNDKALDFIYE